MNTKILKIIAAMIISVFSSQIHGESNNGALYMSGDELVFEYGKFIKIGDTLEHAIGVLEANGFACKQKIDTKESILVCNSYITTGIYGGKQIEVRLVIIDGKVNDIAVTEV